MNGNAECSHMKQLRNRQTTKEAILYFLCGIVNPTGSEVPCFCVSQMQRRNIPKEISFRFSYESKMKI